MTWSDMVICDLKIVICDLKIVICDCEDGNL